MSLHDTDGHNSHAHILVTMRPTANGSTRPRKKYLCVRNGEERSFTAAESKTAQAEGREKQYQYKAGGKKAYMAPPEAENNARAGACVEASEGDALRQEMENKAYNRFKQNIKGWQGQHPQLLEQHRGRRHSAGRIWYGRAAERASAAS
ncbi:MAG: hypothetical protein E7474_06505 [Ruminococcaceae bacterium]|nr:hypothetical protein [Oscillospiraceae bacterium]